MRLAELKARLVGRTIVDVDLSINEEMDAIEIGRITLDDGTQISTEAEHSPVWIDYLLVGDNQEHITISPDHADYPVEEEDDEDPSTWSGEDPDPVVLLSDVLSDDEQAAVLAQCWMSGKLIMEQAVVLVSHDAEPIPFRTMGGKNVSRWYELEWGMNGMTKQPNQTIIGIGIMAGKINIVQAGKLKDEWSSISTGMPE
jgi:hypothetical protein